MDLRRLSIAGAAALACLIAGLVLGVIAIVAGGGLWLLLIGLLFVLAAIVLDQIDSRSEGILATLTEPVVVVAIVVVVLMLGAYAFVEPHRGSTPQASPARPSPHVTAPKTATSPPAIQPAPETPSGAEQADSAVYVTAGTDVHLRAAPTTSSAVLITMTEFATPVSLTCYEPGQVIFSDPNWYRATYDGFVGWVSELWLDTGSVPAQIGLPHC